MSGNYKTIFGSDFPIGIRIPDILSDISDADYNCPAFAMQSDSDSLRIVLLTEHSESQYREFYEVPRYRLLVESNGDDEEIWSSESCEEAMTLMLALEFADSVSKALEPGDLESVRLNAHAVRAENSILCLASDYCDTNDHMLSSWQTVFGYEGEPSSDHFIDVANTAWSFAIDELNWLDPDFLQNRLSSTSSLSPC